MRRDATRSDVTRVFQSLLPFPPSPRARGALFQVFILAVDPVDGSFPPVLPLELGLALSGELLLVSGQARHDLALGGGVDDVDGLDARGKLLERGAGAVTFVQGPVADLFQFFPDAYFFYSLCARFFFPPLSSDHSRSFSQKMPEIIASNREIGAMICRKLRRPTPNQTPPYRGAARGPCRPYRTLTSGNARDIQQPKTSDWRRPNNHLPSNTLIVSFTQPIPSLAHATIVHAHGSIKVSGALGFVHARPREACIFSIDTLSGLLKAAVRAPGQHRHSRDPMPTFPPIPPPP